MFVRSVFLQSRVYSWFAHPLVRTKFFLGRIDSLPAADDQAQTPPSSGPVAETGCHHLTVRSAIDAAHFQRNPASEDTPSRVSSTAPPDKGGKGGRVGGCTWIDSSAIAHPLSLSLILSVAFVATMWCIYHACLITIPLTRLSLSWISYISYLNCIIGLEY